MVAILVGVLWLWPRPAPAVSRILTRHILITFNAGDPADRARAYELAQDLRTRILDGESFKRLAKEYSNDPMSAQRGGSIGWIDRGQFVGKFEEFVWSAPIGELSDVIQTQFGFHLALVEDRAFSEIDLYRMQKKKDESP